MSTTEGTQPIDLVRIGETTTTESWLVSDWAAGQSSIMRWSPDNVVEQADGSVRFTLDAAPSGSTHAYSGGEVQSCAAASTGTWSWTAQAPVMQDGAVFGMFTYREDHFNDPWIEFDFEFVGADTSQVRLNIHMETATGEHVTLEQAKGGPVIVDLGFDAASGFHTYEIVVTETEAIFVVDGHVVGRFGAVDMLYGTWTTGNMKGLANLWCVDPALEAWAGDWSYAGTPLTATIAAIDVLPGDLGDFGPAPSDPAIGGDGGDDILIGTEGDDTLDGGAGNDDLIGAGGDDVVLGGDGDDRLSLDAGSDFLDGGPGIDLIVVNGTSGATIDLAVVAAQETGYGRDVLLNIENASGATGADRLLGDDGANALAGGSGNDALVGRGGDDWLEGGDGDDTFDLDAGNDRLDGGTGSDWVEATGATAVTIDLARRGGQSTGFGTDRLTGIENAAGGSGADSLYGTEGANVLQGNAGGDILHGRGGADILSGRGGSDILVAGTGKDSLYGGADRARDVFVFATTDDSAVGNARDLINDFKLGLDVMDLSGIDADAALAGDQAFGFAGTTAQAHSVWYAAGKSKVIVRADVTGDRKADLEICVAEVTSLTSEDFVF